MKSLTQSKDLQTSRNHNNKQYLNTGNHHLKYSRPILGQIKPIASAMVRIIISVTVTCFVFMQKDFMIEIFV